MAQNRARALALEGILFVGFGISSAAHAEKTLALLNERPDALRRCAQSEQPLSRAGYNTWMELRTHPGHILEPLNRKAVHPA